MKTAIYPGSFDPVTYGHLEIISRASKLFDKVIVLVSVNPLKPCSFTIEERKQFLRESVVAEGTGQQKAVLQSRNDIPDFKKRIYLSVIQYGKADSDVRRRYKRFRSGVHT